MKRTLTKTALALLAFVVSTSVGASVFDTEYSSFRNNGSVGVSEQINAIVADSYGQIWYGTPRGLFSFDGYRSRQATAQVGQIYSLLMLNDTILIGDDNGLSFYCISNNSWHPIEGEPREVRAMLKDGSSIYVGASNGLYKLRTELSESTEIDHIAQESISHPTVYSLAKTGDGTIFVGTYDGLCRMTDGQIDTVKLPEPSNHTNTFVNSLFVDEEQNSLLIGTEDGLFTLDLADQTVTQLATARGNSVKAIRKDLHGNILAGTDNGLFVGNGTNPAKRIAHDAQNPNSLIGNIIWSILRDECDRIWIGTENGFSLANEGDVFVSVDDIAGSKGGNTLYSILRDSHERLWMGGSNGLIMYDTRAQQTRWFQVGNLDANLPHNRIRSIFEDSKGRIWIATDGGVNLFDEKRSQFDRYDITDASGRYNSNWAYDIVEDDDGRLWVATCRGGVLVVDRKTLMASGGSAVAEQVITTADGLPSDYIEKLQIDSRGNVHMHVNRKGVYTYQRESGTIREMLADETVSTIFVDRSDELFAARGSDIVRLDSEGATITRLGEGVRIFALSEDEEGILAATSEGLRLLERNGDRLIPTRTKENGCYTSLFVDRDEAVLYLGGVDGLATLPTSELAENDSKPQVYLTGIYVNEQPYVSNGEARRLTSVDLSADQNSLAFELSDFSYRAAGDYVYRLEGFDTDWHQLRSDDDRIFYLQLKHGDYTLHLGHLSPTGQPCEETSIAIAIASPWYLSTLAFVVYALILIALVLWIMFFFRMKQRLRIEHIEREKTLEQTRLKIDFFTSVSHEFKTPMSLIIGPLSSLTNKVEDPDIKRSLDVVLDSARQLSQMINKALTFARVDNNIESEMNMQNVELVEFARDVFAMHRESPYAQGLELIFNSSEEQVFVEADAVKLESVINNLVQNACKYTHEGRVELSISREDNSILMTVSDTGVGIPADDLPLIFQKYYRSAAGEASQDSSGIGLYLVRQYVERFGGHIEAKSDGEHGSQFIVTLPIAEVQEATAKPDSADQPTGRPVVLIVEDNRQIAEFVESILGPDYDCRIAHNGMAGFEMASKLVPSLVIADIMMPVMSGLEMAQRLKKQHTTAAVPIIMLTAKDDAQTRADSLESNIDAFIAKPFEARHLLLKVRQILNTQSTIESTIRLKNIAEQRVVEIPQSADEKFLAGFVEMVEKNLDDSTLNLNKLADHSNVSPKQLYRKVKSMTGKTPTEFINDMRMQKAALYLSQGAFTVAEVMYMVGYSNASYFAKCFAATWGMTPKVYAQKNRSTPAAE